MAAKDRSTIPGVGSTLWMRREEVRVYARDAAGRSIGGALELPKWQQLFVVDQTNVSLLLDSDMNTPRDRLYIKVPKAGFCDGETPANFARDEAERDARIWANGNRYFIGEAVGRLTEPSLLARIALLAGYDPRGERKPMPASLLAAVRDGGR